MPTYEYSCKNCGNEFERFESITAKVDKSCPKCKKKKAERLISGGGGFIFKGSGFYITDYKNKRSGSDAGKNETPKAEPAKTDAPASKDAPAATPAPSGGGATGDASHSAPAAEPAKSAKSSSKKK